MTFSLSRLDRESKIIMEVKANTLQLKDLLDKSKKILIMIGDEPSIDTVSAGLALNNLFKSHSKITHLVSADKLPENVTLLAESNEITKDLESRNLVISFDYKKNPVEKISYKIDGDKFNLIIKPRMKGLNLDEVETSYVGGDYNLIIILGTQDLRSTKTYSSHSELFESLPTVNIDVNDSNTRFGKLNIIDPKIDSVCGLISLILNQSEVELTEKCANLLLLGMREATQNFTKVKNSKIFEAAAYATKSKENKDFNFSEQNNKEIKSELPKDWLSPKVYRSSKVS